MPEEFELRSMTKAEIAALPDPTVLYDAIEEGRFGHLPNYKCPACPDARIDREALLTHIRVAHIEPVLRDRAAIEALANPNTDESEENLNATSDTDAG